MRNNKEDGYAFRKTEEVLASAQDNSGEEKKENQITNNVDNGTTADGTEKEEQSATETVEEPADSEETNDPFAEIPQVVLSKPVDYSLNQAIRQLEQMEASDERYAQIVENAEKYPEKLLINLANNPEMIAFVADYKGNTRDYDKAELTEKELQEEYPLFLQWDKRWGCLAYGDDSNVAISGCGPTTLAMAVVALTGNEEATPAAIAKFAMQEGFYMSGTGTMWSLMTEGAAAYGVRSEHNDMELISNSRDYEKSKSSRHYKTDDVFPSLNTTYKINDQHQVRLSYGRSINRPEFREVSSSVYYDFDLASNVGCCI